MQPRILLVAGALSATLLVDSRSRGEEPACPEGMVLLDPTTCIDAFEATLVEIDASGADVGPHSPYLPVGEKRVRAVSKRDVIPQAYISQVEALAACQTSKKRLCTDAEWLRACKGAPATRYPYGERHRRGHCNDAGTEVLPVVFPGRATDLFRLDRMNDPRLNQVPGSVARTGAFSACESGQGIFDMVGNLHEWTADSAGTLRGGYYLDTHTLGEGCEYEAIGHDDHYHDYSTGFRCCSDVASRDR